MKERAHQGLCPYTQLSLLIPGSNTLHTEASDIHNENKEVPEIQLEDFVLCMLYQPPSLKAKHLRKTLNKSPMKNSPG